MMLLKDLAREKQEMIKELLGLKEVKGKLPFSESMYFNHIPEINEKDTNKEDIITIIKGFSIYMVGTSLLYCHICGTYYVKKSVSRCLNCQNSKAIKNSKNATISNLTTMTHTKHPDYYDILVETQELKHYFYVNEHKQLKFIEESSTKKKNKQYYVRVFKNKIVMMTPDLQEETYVAMKGEVLEALHDYMAKHLASDYRLFLDKQGLFTKTGKMISFSKYQIIYERIKNKKGLENIYNLYLNKDKNAVLNTQKLEDITQNKATSFSDFRINKETVKLLKPLKYAALTSGDYFGNTMPVYFESFTKTYEKYEAEIQANPEFWNKMILGFEDLKEKNKSMKLTFRQYATIAFILKPKDMFAHNEKMMSMFKTTAQFNKNITFYIDYLTMSVEFDFSYKKYPENIATIHDVRAKEVSLLMKNKENGEIDEKIQSIYEGKHYTGIYANHVVISPTSLFHLLREGENLAHCIAGYTPMIINKETLIYFLRKEESPDTSYITIEIMNNQIVQAKGNLNRFLTKEELTILDVFAEAEGLDVNLYK